MQLVMQSLIRSIRLMLMYAPLTMALLQFMPLQASADDAAGVQQSASEPVTGTDKDSGTGTEAAQATAPVVSVPLVNVMMSTALGNITVAIDPQHAPITAANFLRYVDDKRFDGITFYRAVKIGDSGQYGLVQGGLRNSPKKIFPPIAHESTTQTGLSHLNGAISMARLAPGSAQADFFIVMGDVVTLDARPDAPGDNLGYAVFGRVVEGMDIIKQMVELPRSDTAKSEAMKGQMLAEPVVIHTVRRVTEQAH